MVGPHPILAVAVGLAVGTLVAFAATIAPGREVTSPIITAWWRVVFPLFLGFEAWNAADRHGWIVAVAMIIGAGAVVAASVWERRKRA